MNNVLCFLFIENSVKKAVFILNLGLFYFSKNDVTWDLFIYIYITVSSYIN